MVLYGHLEVSFLINVKLFSLLQDFIIKSKHFVNKCLYNIKSDLCGVALLISFCFVCVSAIRLFVLLNNIVCSTYVSPCAIFC